MNATTTTPEADLNDSCPAFILTKFDRQGREVEVWFMPRPEGVVRERWVAGQLAEVFAPLTRKEGRKRWSNLLAAGYEWVNRGEFPNLPKS